VIVLLAVTAATAGLHGNQDACMGKQHLTPSHGDTPTHALPHHSIKDMLYKKRMERELLRAKGLLKEAEKPPEEVGAPGFGRPCAFAVYLWWWRKQAHAWRLTSALSGKLYGRGRCCVRLARDVFGPALS
jgi:hypothetical protein